jgi:hypothetical protein
MAGKSAFTRARSCNSVYRDLGLLVGLERHLVALVLRSNVNFTLPVGLQSFFQQNSTNWGLVMVER